MWIDRQKAALGHTYIISHYNPSEELAPQTTYVVYDNFYKWVEEHTIYSFNYPQNFCQKSDERELPRIYFVIEIEPVEIEHL